MLKEVLLIGLGGFIGSVARYYVSKMNLSVDLFSIPFGTLLVNVLGSLILGF
ncbi:MAG: CrcB family protein, partial [Bacteroidales bacterium]|nr:CrcB family protein [Bacteroidales bacterium]